MQGEQYSNGFMMASSRTYYVLFNLKQKYSALEFDFGHVYNSGDQDGTIAFYVDDILIKSIKKGYQDDITHESMPLNYGKRLKIEISTGGTAAGYAYYGLANAVLVY